MPKSTYCTYKSDKISVNDAIEIRERLGRIQPDFRCIECCKPVRPHKASGTMAAHFDHMERNKHCILCDTR